MRSQDSQNGNLENSRGGINEWRCIKSDMKELTKSYYDALKRIKELNEENTKLKEKVIVLDKIANHFIKS